MFICIVDFPLYNHHGPGDTISFHLLTGLTIFGEFKKMFLKIQQSLLNVNEFHSYKTILDQKYLWVELPLD